ncbi:hypothetical protein FRUB_09495 [Fimbriiglobus ruber]|uniref:Glycosyl transferase family 1 domain-containing protein n=1 Tax=Fimbriiglobus ruber TaxID=1908690 RepID=A0A225D6Q6_9BACT|nr:hypothetical protein FRUB_09495 [Fimbriiglobus ruber]
MAVEAMANGIPVIGSARGGLVEVLREGGVTVDIPVKHTPDTRTPPTQDEVKDWVTAIVHLWDSPSEYVRLAERAKETAAQLWHSNVLIPRWIHFLSQICKRI